MLAAPTFVGFISILQNLPIVDAGVGGINSDVIKGTLVKLGDPPTLRLDKYCVVLPYLEKGVTFVPLVLNEAIYLCDCPPVLYKL